MESEKISGVRINEPWLGLWQDTNITVTCQAGSQLRFSPTNICQYFPHEDTLGACEDHEFCLVSDECLIKNLGEGIEKSDDNLEYLKNKAGKIFATLSYVSTWFSILGLQQKGEGIVL